MTAYHIYSLHSIAVLIRETVKYNGSGYFSPKYPLSVASVCPSHDIYQDIKLGLAASLLRSLRSAGCFVAFSTDCYGTDDDRLL